MNIQFIPNDPEQILAETIASYTAQYGAPLQPADPERLVIDVMAYRESILRGQMEHLMRQNFVQYATAPYLDAWGALFGVVRLIDETDDAYRGRILESTHEAIGTEAAYRSAILAVEGVCDLVIERKNDDPTLPPGVVRLTPLVRSLVDGVAFGAPHSTQTERAIDAVLYAEAFGVLGPMFVYRRAVPVPISGTITVRPVLGFTAQQIEQNVRKKTIEYFGKLSQSFSSAFGVFDLERAVAAAAGVLGVTGLDFVNVPTLAPGDFHTIGQVTISVQ